jgi:hypothetical protein
MSTTNHLQITLVDSNQSAPEVTVNAGTVRLEEAAHKQLSVAMGDANATLTDSQFNNYRNYKCTGANAAQRDLVVPAREREFVVKNSTTGGFGVQVKTSSGTGVVVPSGETTICYCDGTNVEANAGAGTGGAVTSVFTRSGDVVAAVGDYDFTQLGDVPTVYTGDGGKIVKVKATEDGLEFATAASGVTLKTDGTSNGTQSILDLLSGTGIALTDNGDGTVEIENTSIGGTPAWLDYHPDKPPSSPNAMDDEFDAGSLNTSLWTWGNQGTSTATQANSRLTMEGQVSGGDNIRYIYQTLPAAPCEFTAKIGFPRPSGSLNYMLAGIGIRYAAGDDFFLGGWTNNGDPYIMSATFNTVTSSATNGVQSAAAVFVPPMYWRMKVTSGTDVDFSYSIDGVNFIRQRSMPFGTAFAGNSPDQVLLFSNPNNTTASATIVVEWFRRTA